MLNEVFLVGELQSEVREIFTKKDEKYLNFRLRVPRADVGSDSIVCVVHDESLMKKVLDLGIQDEISIAGRLQSRYFRALSGTANVMEVHVQDLLVLD